MRKFVLTLIFISFFLPINAMAEKFVFVTCDYPPLGFVKEGQIVGTQVEIIRELCNRLGFESEIQVLPWKRALKHVEDGVADAIFAIRRNEEREKFLYYLSEPIGFERAAILARKGSGIKATAMNDLRGKVIGVVRGYAYGFDFDDYKDIKRIICNNDRQLLKLLGAERLSLIAGGDEATIKYIAREAEVEVETVYVMKETPGYIAFSRKAIDKKEKYIVEKFSQTLRQLREEGVIQKIESKYF